MRLSLPMLLLIPMLLLTSNPLPLLEAAQYDPLRVPESFTAETLKLDVIDTAREREIPLQIYLPESQAAAPVVLFSHGLGGDREACSYLGQHWAARGYVGVFMQHAGSDASIWRDKPIPQRMAAMRQAASNQNFVQRVQDVSAVLDQLTKWNEQPGHSLDGRLDMQHVGMSGHSFGALTTQAVSGQSAGRFARSTTDSRIQAAIALSPSSPRRGDPKTAFQRVAIPWLLMTGTNDTAVIGDQTLASRLAVFPALPPGDKYQLVLDRAEHSAFSERRSRGDTQPRNPNHHRAIKAISTAFWDSYLRNDERAKQWLGGTAVRSVLQPLDRFESK